jgi:predicted ester cyclase
MLRAVVAVIAVAGVPGALAQTQKPDNAAILKKCHEWGNTGKLAEYAGCFAENATNHGRPVTKAGILLVMEDLHRAFPDYHSTHEAVVVDGDTVVTLSRNSGTHRGIAQTTVNGGMLQGAKPTGKRFEVLSTHWWVFKDGKIVSHRAVRDDLGMMLQLGLLPKELPAELKVAKD